MTTEQKPLWRRLRHWWRNYRNARGLRRDLTTIERKLLERYEAERKYKEKVDRDEKNAELLADHDKNKRPYLGKD